LTSTRGTSKAYQDQKAVPRQQKKFYSSKPVFIPSSNSSTPLTFSTLPSFPRSLSLPLSAMLGNPLFLVKARLQAYSPLHAIGKASSRYNYSGTFDGLRSIVKADGPSGLIRGIDAAVLRTAMGSTVQLPAYNWLVTL